MKTITLLAFTFLVITTAVFSQTLTGPVGIGTAPTTDMLTVNGNTKVLGPVSIGINNYPANPQLGLTLFGKAEIMGHVYIYRPDYYAGLGLMSLTANSSNSPDFTFNDNVGGGFVLRKQGNQFTIYDGINPIAGFGQVGSHTFFTSGNVGIGTYSPNAKLDVNGNIFSNGKIAIGTTDFNKIGTHSLAVNGSAIFTKAVVKLYTAPWPDYVFHQQYKLATLEELEKYIRINKHLPDVPTAQEIEKDGIDLGHNQALLLKKIEELTLLLIQQNKRIEQLERGIRKK